jgi:hypothetical protein
MVRCRWDARTVCHRTAWRRLGNEDGDRDSRCKRQHRSHSNGSRRHGLHPLSPSRRQLHIGRTPTGRKKRRGPATWARRSRNVTLTCGFGSGRGRFEPPCDLLCVKQIRCEFATCNDWKRARQRVSRMSHWSSEEPCFSPVSTHSCTHASKCPYGRIRRPREWPSHAPLLGSYPVGCQLGSEVLEGPGGVVHGALLPKPLDQ